MLAAMRRASSRLSRSAAKRPYSIFSDPDQSTSVDWIMELAPSSGLDDRDETRQSHFKGGADEPMIWPTVAYHDCHVDRPNMSDFSNRPFGVKRFQTIHHCSVDVAHGLVLLFGIGTKALPSWDSKTRWNNLRHDLAVRRTAGSSGHANSPHPSSREGHLSTAWWSSSFLLSDVIL